MNFEEMKTQLTKLVQLEASLNGQMTELQKQRADIQKEMIENGVSAETISGTIQKLQDTLNIEKATLENLLNDLNKSTSIL